MKLRSIVVGLTLAALAVLPGVASASQLSRAQLQPSARTRGRAPRAAKKAHLPPALVSVNLAGFGSSSISPRGPYQVRPSKIAFDFGSYYGAGTHGLWINDLKWVDWGKPTAYASGVVHARVWPSHRFIKTAGGIMLDQLYSCGTKPRSYYTYAAMLVPGGFPQNTTSIAYSENEPALTPC